MKKIAITLFSLVFAITLLAQQAPPQGINYQAMVYAPYSNQQPGVNSAGQIPANTKQVIVKFTLEEGNNGPVIYEETLTDTTDQYGLLNAVIGTGTPTSNSPGLFNQIDWSLGDPYLSVSITLVEYNSTVTSYQKLWSVPYALYADQANSADTANYATNSGHADSSDYADLAGNGITGVTDNGNGTLTFTYLDGSTYTTPVLTGLMGAPGPQGPAGQNGQSAYDIWLSQGNSGTEQDFLNSLTGQQGTNGPSAYDIWLSQGNTGTQQDFLSSLQGATGLTGPQGSVGSTGPQGPAGQNGNNGLSAYDIWLAQGNIGTQQDFLNSIIGSQGPAGPNGPQGPVGNNGQNNLVKTSTESAGVNCSSGGVKIESGLDSNNNGTLEITEINPALTKYICNGATGAIGPQGAPGLNAGPYLNGGIANCLNCITMVSNIYTTPSSVIQCADYCKNLTENGYSDWRLPTIKEILHYRVELELPIVWVDQYIWSSTINFTTPTSHAFNEVTGQIISDPLDLSIYGCRCVR